MRDVGVESDEVEDERLMLVVGGVIGGLRE